MVLSMFGKYLLLVLWIYAKRSQCYFWMGLIFGGDAGVCFIDVAYKKRDCILWV